MNPHKPDTMLSEKGRKSDIQWLDLTWSSRKNDPLESREIIIMQRLHQSDATGWLLEQADYEHLVIPMGYEPNRTYSIFGVRGDPRTEKGELMHPRRFPLEAVEDLKKKLGPYGSSSQLQQQPSPTEGGIFKVNWFRCWAPEKMIKQLGPAKLKDHNGYEHEVPVIALPDIESKEAEHYQSWDCSFKDLADSDYVGGLSGFRVAANMYLMDMIKERLSFINTLEAIRDMTGRFPQFSRKLVEAKANGIAAVNMLQNEIPGLVEVEPFGSKESRAHAVTPVMASGNVIIPHPKMASWVEEFVKDVISFPVASSDDLVDALTQLLAEAYVLGPQTSMTD